MFFSILAFLIALVCLLVVGFVLFRHWHEIRLLNPLSIKEEKQRQTRDSVIRRRFERLRAEQRRFVHSFGSRGLLWLKDAYRRMEGSLKTWESLHKSVTSQMRHFSPTTRDRMKDLLTEAKTLVRDLKWVEAEKRYLEILTLDALHADAYRGLGHVYLRQKFYAQAKETFLFLVKIKQADDAVFAGLAEIAEAEGQWAEAETLRRRAMEFYQRNACRQAELARFYLQRMDAVKAFHPAERALELEPKSAKYAELMLEIAIMANERKKALDALERLRLLSDDAVKFRQWQEKVEELMT